MKKCITALLTTCALFLAVNSATAAAVTFTKLTGITGGQIAGTGVYRADLSGLGLTSISQIILTDISQGFGGFTGQFSGFDLDAIVLSNTSVDTAAAAKTVATLPGFNYFPAAGPGSPGTLITPGTQRAPVDPKLFGTVLGPVRIDPTVATLDIGTSGSATLAMLATAIRRAWGEAPPPLFLLFVVATCLSRAFFWKVPCVSTG